MYISWPQLLHIYNEGTLQSSIKNPLVTDPVQQPARIGLCSLFSSRQVSASCYYSCPSFTEMGHSTEDGHSTVLHLVSSRQRLAILTYLHLIYCMIEKQTFHMCKVSKTHSFLSVQLYLKEILKKKSVIVLYKLKRRALKNY